MMSDSLFLVHFVFYSSRGVKNTKINKFKYCWYKAEKFNVGFDKLKKNFNPFNDNSIEK